MRTLTVLVALLAIVAILPMFGQTFTDLDDPTYHGKTKIPELTTALDANFAMLEGDGVTVAAATVTATESGTGPYQRVVLTLDDFVVVVDGTAGQAFGGAKICTLPIGRIAVLGCVVDALTITVDATNLDAADGGDISLGSTITADVTLDGTDIDAAPSTSVDPITNIIDVALAATPTAQLDGTSTAITLNLNMLIDDADIGAVLATNTVDATITFPYVNVGDN